MRSRPRSHRARARNVAVWVGAPKAQSTSCVAANRRESHPVPDAAPHPRTLAASPLSPPAGRTEPVEKTDVPRYDVRRSERLAGSARATTAQAETHPIEMQSRFRAPHPAETGRHAPLLAAPPARV